MIREVTMFQAACDRCGTAHDDDGYLAWAEPEQAEIVAMEDGYWPKIGGRLLCGDCWQWSEDEEEMVEKPPLPSSSAVCDG